MPANPISRDEMYRAKRRNIISTHIFYCGNATDVDEKDHVVVGGDTYSVVFVSNPMSKGVFLKVYLRLEI